MKKARIFITILLVFAMFVPFVSVSAKTINDLKKDIEAIKAEKSKSEAEKAQIEKRINDAQAALNTLGNQIEEAKREQVRTEAEIVKLGLEIQNKKAQMKELIIFYQVSDNDNFYLKYLFGAENFTDFIYRFSVIEQITARTDELVEEMNALIAENELKLIELAELEKKSKELYEQTQKKLASLGSERRHFIEETPDYDTQIKAVEDNIKFYRNQGCKDSDDLSKCAGSVPFDFGFDRPLKKGYLSSEFGYDLLNGAWRWHNGVDIAGNNEGTSIYAPAAGRVTYIYKATSPTCGGNQLVMNHNVNGKNYSTRYLHLLSIKVNKGDIVTKGQVIATVGGGSQTSKYETCSTGAHLHFEIATGHYYGTTNGSYSNFSTYISKTFNPREMIYFPKGGIRW